MGLHHQYEREHCTQASVSCATDIALRGIGFVQALRIRLSPQAYVANIPRCAGQPGKDKLGCATTLRTDINTARSLLPYHLPSESHF